MEEALQKYSFKILQSMQEFGIEKNEIVKKDLLECLKKIQGIMRDFGNSDIHWKAIFDDKQLCVLALSNYISELEESKKTLHNIIGKIEMNNTEEQINSTKELVERIRNF